MIGRGKEWAFPVSAICKEGKRETASALRSSHTVCGRYDRRFQERGGRRRETGHARAELHAGRDEGWGRRCAGERRCVQRRSWRWVAAAQAGHRGRGTRVGREGLGSRGRVRGGPAVRDEPEGVGQRGGDRWPADGATEALAGVQHDRYTRRPQNRSAAGVTRLRHPAAAQQKLARRSYFAGSSLGPPRGLRS